MLRINGSLSRTRKITYTGILIGLAISMRLVKYALFGPMQFISFPGVFTIIGGVLFGPATGLVVGFASYLLSDMIIGLPGPWTAVNAVLMAGVGVLSGIVWSRKDKTKISKTGLGVGTFVLMLGFDILASWILFVVIGFDLITALIFGVLGLFIPNVATGGFMIAIGPITEGATALLVVLVTSTLIKNSRARLSVSS